MAVKQTFNKAPKLKIVTVIENVPLSNSEEGELYYDATTGKINLRTDAGYVLFTKDT